MLWLCVEQNTFVKHSVSESGKIPMPLNANGASSDYGADKIFLIEGNSLLDVSQPSGKDGEFQYPETCHIMCQHE